VWREGCDKTSRAHYLQHLHLKQIHCGPAMTAHGSQKNKLA
jgi:hypothetical protein